MADDFAFVGGNGRLSMRALGSSTLALASTLVLLQTLQGRTDAVVINGTEMTMDQAIMAAAGSSKMFRLMEDANVVRIEMDMLFKAEVWESMMRARENSNNRRHRRKAIREQTLRWSNATVPYQIAVSWSDRDNQQFQEALSDYHRYTCVRFRQATASDADYVRVVDGGGCSSYVGRQGGAQTVTLASGCRHKGVIVHELGHALGFHHEQTRPDRDSYVQVVKENIDSFMLFNFNKYTATEVDTVGVPYDYLSVMHYGEYAFSQNGQRTILTTDPKFQSRIGNRGGLSFRDAKAVNAIYGCAARSKCRERQCPGEGFVGQDCACWCPSGNDSRSVMQCSDQLETTTAAATAAASRCSDEHDSCSKWATIGHCSNAVYRAYMSANCKATCNLCSSVTQATPTNARTVSRQTQPSSTGRPQQTTPSASSRRPTVVDATTARGRSCHDANAMCSAWAERGECDANPRYMLAHCSASCRSCDGATETTTAAAARCNDTEVHCDYWRGRGYCVSQLYAAYMQLNCPRACGVCSTVGTATVVAATVRTTPKIVARATTTTPRPSAKQTTTQRGGAAVARSSAASAVGKLLKKFFARRTGAFHDAANDYDEDDDDDDEQTEPEQEPWSSAGGQEPGGGSIVKVLLFGDGGGGGGEWQRKQQLVVDRRVERHQHVVQQQTRRDPHSHKHEPPRSSRGGGGDGGGGTDDQRQRQQQASKGQAKGQVKRKGKGHRAADADDRH